MVRLRLSRRLAGRIDDSDVLQESFLEIAKRLEDYLKEPTVPFFLWLRHMTGLKLVEIHRRHLGAHCRDADREVTLHRGGLPMADSVSLAAQLLGTWTTPSQAAIKAETRLYVQQALNSMDPIDREVLALKHFEQLSTSEIARGAGPVQGRGGEPLSARSSACGRSFRGSQSSKRCRRTSFPGRTYKPRHPPSWPSYRADSPSSPAVMPPRVTQLPDVARFRHGAHDHAAQQHLHGVSGEETRCRDGSNPLLSRWKNASCSVSPSTTRSACPLIPPVTSSSATTTARPAGQREAVEEIPASGAPAFNLFRLSEGPEAYPGALVTLGSSAMLPNLSSGAILELQPNGDLYAYTPSTGQVAKYDNFAADSSDESSVFDLQTETYRNLDGDDYPGRRHLRRLRRQRQRPGGLGTVERLGFCHAGQLLREWVGRRDRVADHAGCIPGQRSTRPSPGAWLSTGKGSCSRPCRPRKGPTFRWPSTCSSTRAKRPRRRSSISGSPHNPRSRVRGITTDDDGNFVAAAVATSLLDGNPGYVTITADLSTFDARAHRDGFDDQCALCPLGRRRAANRDRCTTGRHDSDGESRPHRSLCL